MTSTTASGTALRTSDSIHAASTTYFHHSFLSVFCLEPVLFQPWFEVWRDGPLRVENENFRQPAIGRDAGWLLSAEIVAVFLAFIGQIILTRELLAEEYGWLVLAIDIYASVFLIADLGLPTLLARDGAGNPQGVRSAVGRIYRFQGIAFVCFLSIALFLQPLNWFGNEAPQYLAMICILISFIHIASFVIQNASKQWMQAIVL